MDPARLDINVHPTYQEIKFDDDKMMYNYLKVATRHALGQYSVTPSLDFEQEPLFNQAIPSPSNVTFERIPSSFSRESGERSVQQDHYDRSTKEEVSRHRNNLENWQDLNEEKEEEEDLKGGEEEKRKTLKEEKSSRGRPIRRRRGEEGDV